MVNSVTFGLFVSCVFIVLGFTGGRIEKVVRQNEKILSSKSCLGGVHELKGAVSYYDIRGYTTKITAFCKGCGDRFDFVSSDSDLADDS